MVWLDLEILKMNDLKHHKDCTNIYLDWTELSQKAEQEQYKGKHKVFTGLRKNTNQHIENTLNKSFIVLCEVQLAF